MKPEEIKKLYTKTKRALEKRTGEKFTWVMNAKQQRIGTATVCVASAFDNVKAVEAAREQANGKAAEKAAKTWNAFQLHAQEEAASTEPCWNPTFWRDALAELGTQVEYIAKEQKKADDLLSAAEAFLKQHGTQLEMLDESHEYAKELIAGPEISAFLHAIGGTASIEDRYEHGAIYVYIRFHYSPST